MGGKTSSAEFGANSAAKVVAPSAAEFAPAPILLRKLLLHIAGINSAAEVVPLYRIIKFRCGSCSSLSQVQIPLLIFFFPIAGTNSAAMLFLPIAGTTSA